jgi:hypothetical protein
MMDARLPRVDREALIVEESPEMLDAYARGLWQHWQALDGQGEKLAKGYPKTTVKAAVVWLIGAYVDAEAPLPYEMFRLIGAIIRPQKDASTSPVRTRSEKAYWAAIKFEAQAPSTTMYAVAKHLRDTGAFPTSHTRKTAEGTVRGWRKLPHYQDNVRLYRKAKS